MSSIPEIADKLALEVIAVAEALDDEGLVNEVAQVLGASSPSTEEAFRTAARVRLAEARARRFIEDRLSRAEAALKAQRPT